MYILLQNSNSAFTYIISSNSYNNPEVCYISLKDKDFKLYRKIITFSPSRQQMIADSKKCFISYMIAFKGVLI